MSVLISANHRTWNVLEIKQGKAVCNSLNMQQNKENDEEK